MLTWAYDIKTGSLTISGEFENGQKLAVAYYDQNGRMVQVKLLTQAQTLAAVETARGSACSCWIRITSRSAGP